MKICKDGRIWGQTNKQSGDHLGKLKRQRYIKGDCLTKGYKDINNYIKKGQKGNKNPNWKGGITPYRNKIWHSEEYKRWRKMVFERDNYTCLICGEVGGRLNVHHIKSFKKYPELRFEINNGTTLCIDCHRLTNNYGRKKSSFFMGG